MLYSKDLVSAVREMLDRHRDIYEIASKIRVDPVVVKNIVDLITDQLT
jgi:hypothetical protein